ncbi:reverse transcriptase domain-containing protein [Tanacetum coccineum]
MLTALEEQEELIVYLAASKEVVSAVLMTEREAMQMPIYFTNKLVERANRSLGEGIKARLGKDNKNWLEEISHVLWAHRTMIKSSNGDTPFSLTYGTEAVIPAEIGMPMFRTTEVDVAENDEALEINLELLEEK